ncbi:DUF3347 domain-containing protein [Robiginitalea sediminis]|uniref:DUF3347 domain-containing protein n=1 Tax=Robiginitalea sediminis TaxID=1982593 RepID=UPI000B4ABB43|nr:DUF3347 domain-containing protein [Robiginitalea sediminis]
MNMYFKSTLTLVLLLVFLGCKEDKKQEAAPTAAPANETAAPVAQATGPEFADASAQMAWDRYMDLRLALVETDAETAAQAAGSLATMLEEGYPELTGIARGISVETDVEKQRALFSEFIGQSEGFFEQALTGGTLYKQFCPMAFGNTGGYWLSDVAEIRNPYFGDKMLTCGKVEESITP